MSLKNGVKYYQVYGISFTCKETNPVLTIVASHVIGSALKRKKLLLLGASLLLQGNHTFKCDNPVLEIFVLKYPQRQL